MPEARVETRLPRTLDAPAFDPETVARFMGTSNPIFRGLGMHLVQVDIGMAELSP